MVAGGYPLYWLILSTHVVNKITLICGGAGACSGNGNEQREIVFAMHHGWGWGVGMMGWGREWKGWDGGSPSLGPLPRQFANASATHSRSLTNKSLAHSHTATATVSISTHFWKDANTPTQTTNKLTPINRSTRDAVATNNSGKDPWIHPLR